MTTLALIAQAKTLAPSMRDKLKAALLELDHSILGYEEEGNGCPLAASARAKLAGLLEQLNALIKAAS